MDRASTAYLLIFAGDSTRIEPLPDQGSLCLRLGEGGELIVAGGEAGSGDAGVARLLVDHGSVTVEELEGSTLQVNGERSAKPRVLAAGDMLSIGADLSEPSPLQ